MGNNDDFWRRQDRMAEERRRLNRLDDEKRDAWRRQTRERDNWEAKHRALIAEQAEQRAVVGRLLAEGKPEAAAARLGVSLDSPGPLRADPVSAPPPPQALAAPQLSVRQEASGATWSWTAVPGAAGYVLQGSWRGDFAQAEELYRGRATAYPSTLQRFLGQHWGAAGTEPAGSPELFPLPLRRRDRRRPASAFRVGGMQPVWFRVGAIGATPGQDSPWSPRLFWPSDHPWLTPALRQTDEA